MRFGCVWVTAVRSGHFPGQQDECTQLRDDLEAEMEVASGAEGTGKSSGDSGATSGAANDPSVDDVVHDLSWWSMDF